MNKKLGNNFKHGMSDSKEYRIWTNIKTRCLNKNNPKYKDYGSRGISVCKEWVNSFENFYKDMGACRENDSIDRIDNNGNYCKENCRWACLKEQANNKRSNRLLTYKGQTKTAAKWAEDFNMIYNTLSSRINMYGWSIEKALTSPIKRKNYGKN